MDANAHLEELKLARQIELRNASSSGDSCLQRFYGGKVVFITGGSGFLGKQLIEKLLRTCKISKVFMLLRPKKGNSTEQRLMDLCNDSVFDTLKEEQPNFVDKIVPVPGDVSEMKLGIRDQDWQTLTNEVDVIFHAAATTRFDEPLRVTTMINLRGTRECLALAKSCKNLCAYVHVSTAYTHCSEKLAGREVGEKFYKCPIAPQTMISVAEEMDDDRLARITADLIKDWPNTYTFTKALSEELIRTTSDGLPICIVRPGIVLSSRYEPQPGWIDKSAVYSASGVIIGLALGLIHTVAVNGKLSMGIVPCDYVNNAIIAAGREAAVTQNKGGDATKIYFLSPTCRNPVTWDDCAQITRKNRRKIPSPKIVYHGFVVETTSYWLFYILSLILHIIPACIADGVCLLLGKERRFVKLANKLYRMCSAVSFFLLNEWNMTDHNTANLYESLSDQDKVLFNFDITDINWDQYVLVWLIGLRKYLVQDGLKDTKFALRKQTLLQILHYVMTPLYFYGLYKISWMLLSFVAGFVATLVHTFSC